MNSWKFYFDDKRGSKEAHKLTTVIIVVIHSDVFEVLAISKRIQRNENRR